MTTLQHRFLRVFLNLAEYVFPEKRRNYFEREVAFQIRLSDGVKITGLHINMKVEFGQYIDIKAIPLNRKGNPSHIEAGSASFQLSATDSDGNDVSGDFSRVDDGSDELSARFQHDGTEVECTGVITLRADGDPDADEQFPVVGTLDFVVDAPNTVTFDLQGTVGDPEPATDGGDTGDTDTGDTTGEA
jgi:hypothetical protein